MIKEFVSTNNTKRFLADAEPETASDQDTSISQKVVYSFGIGNATKT